jgi:hypothetical protein
MQCEFMEYCPCCYQDCDIRPRVLQLKNTELVNYRDAGYHFGIEAYTCSRSGEKWQTEDQARASILSKGAAIERYHLDHPGELNLRPIK